MNITEQEVREVLESCGQKLEYVSIESELGEVTFKFSGRDLVYTVTHKEVMFCEEGCPDETQYRSHEVYKETGGYRFVIGELISLLTRDSEPTLEQQGNDTPYSDTAEGIEKLKARIQELEQYLVKFRNDNIAHYQSFIHWKSKHDELQKDRDHWKDESDRLCREKQALEEQLQGCVSQEDHEKEMKAWETAFEKQIEYIQLSGRCIRERNWSITIEL